MAGFTDGLKAFPLTIEPRDYAIPRVKARHWYDGDYVVGLHHAFGVELLTEWAEVEFAGLSGGGIDAVRNIGAAYRCVLLRPLGAAKSRHDERAHP
jgi:hypothetical protein